MRERKIKLYDKGIINAVPAEEIPENASPDSLSWFTRDGRIELARGRIEVGEMTDDGYYGVESTTPQAGGVFNQIFAPAKDGTLYHYRKVNTRIEVFEPSTEEWVPVIEGLTDRSLYFFAPYSSLAGNFLFIGGPDGLYKIHLGSPYSYKSMYNVDRNHYGYLLINEARMFMWNLFDESQDKTALYLSKIDPQGTNYTAVTGENVGTGDGVETSFEDTLVQATGTRFVFGVSITAGAITGRDDGNGNIVGDGVSGIINYATGVLTLLFTAPVPNSTAITADYQYEDSNTNGITDFRYSSTRLAGEGDFIPQEYLGEPIQTVLVGLDGNYYSFKQTCVYQLVLTADDTNASNTLFRTNIGIPNPLSAKSTGRGIAFMDTANPDRPFLSMLAPNPMSGNLEPFSLTPQFLWSEFNFDDCFVDTWGESILVGARTPDSDFNNRFFFVNSAQKYSVDMFYYGVNNIAKKNGLLYGGSSTSEVVFELFSGFDDLDAQVVNYWLSKPESIDDDILKKVRFFQFKGLISEGQVVQVSASYDNAPFELVGTIRGDQSYVDVNSPQLIGNSMLGDTPIGGGIPVTVFPFLMEMRVRTSAFRTCQLRFEATEFGYVAFEWHKFFDILTYRRKLPTGYRQRRHVSTDGESVDNPNR